MVPQNEPALLAEAIASHQARFGTTTRHAVAPPSRAGTEAFRRPVGGGELHLQIDVTTARILAAWHTGIPAKPAAAVLDLLCDELHNIPLTRAADEAVTATLRRATDGMTSAPVAGILLPRNAGLLFVELQRILNEARRAYPGASGLVPHDWMQLSADARIARVDRLIADYLVAHAPNNGAQLVVEAIESGLDGVPVRVVLADHAVGQDFLTAPRILAIERHLKRALFRAIEVLINERPDRNKLRGKIVSSKVQLRPIMMFEKKD